LSFCRLNDDKVRQVPRKGGRPPSFCLTTIAPDCRGVTAPIVHSAIPRHNHREFARSDFQRIESTEGPAADDDFDGLPLGCARGERFLARRGRATFD
jgi:hypothetical protein